MIPSKLLIHYKVIDTIAINLTLEQSLTGLEIPSEIKKTLAIVDVQYVSFDNQLHQGQIVTHQDVAKEIQEIFAHICSIRFPIQHAIPIVKYNWDDEASMLANNTSAFNYRVIQGTTELSNHSYGLAIDINPALNPCMTRSGDTVPVDAIYNPESPGTITASHEIVSAFLSRGWKWGGNWERKDWQHFDKKP